MEVPLTCRPCLLSLLALDGEDPRERDAGAGSEHHHHRQRQHAPGPETGHPPGWRLLQIQPPCDRRQHGPRRRGLHRAPPKPAASRRGVLSVGRRGRASGAHAHGESALQVLR